MADRNQDTIKQMLGGLNSDSRITSNRQGNPLEQAIAAGSNSLTEHELYKLFYESGVKNEDFDNLDPKSKEAVANGLFRLWKIDRFGKEVEDKDQRNIPNVQELKDVYEQRVREKSYAAQGWLRESTRNLVQLAGMVEEPKEERSRIADRVYGNAESYVKFLKRSGENYEDAANRRLVADTLYEIRDYLKKREGDMANIQGELNKLGNNELDYFVNRSSSGV